HIYWTDEAWGGGSIGRANLDGSNVERGFMLVGDDPWGIAANDRYLYWTLGNPFVRGSIGRANLDGSGVTPALISPSVYPVLGLRMVWSYVSWSSDPPSSHVGRAALDGSGANESFGDLTSGSTFMAVGP